MGRARTQPGWTYRELATGHAPYVTAPDELVAVLLDLATAAVRSGTPPAATPAP